MRILSRRGRIVRCALFAAVSIVGSAPLRAQASAAAKPRFTIVALGDSYASGEGSPEVHGNHAPPLYVTGQSEVWATAGDSVQRYHARRCHRSPRSTSAVAAESLRVRYPEIDVTYVSFACSGAEIRHLYAESYEGIEAWLLNDPKLPPQLSQVNEHFRNDPARSVDALVMNIGGNDLQFALVVALCTLMPDSITVVALKQCNQNAALRESLARFLDSLPPRYGRLAAAINGTGPGALRASLRPAAVYITEYPDMTHQGRATGAGTNPENYCTKVPWMTDLDMAGNTTAAESRFVHDNVLVPLNQRVRTAAQAAGWIYVDGAMAGAYEHGMCAASGRWFRTNGEAVRIQGADAVLRQSFNPAVAWLPANRISSGAIHPTEAGYRAMAQYLLDDLDAQLRRKVAGITLAVAAPQLVVDTAVAPLATMATPTAEAIAPRAVARPTGVVQQSIAAGRITVRWNDPVSGGAHHYVLEVDGQARELPAGTRSYTFAGSGRIRFSVRACAALLCSPPSNTLTVSNVVPPVPGNLRAVSTPGMTHFAGTIDLAWTADETAEFVELHYRRASETTRPGPGAIATPVRAAATGPAGGYQVQRAVSSPARLGAPNAPLPSGSYEIKARACSHGGCSAFTDVITVAP